MFTINEVCNEKISYDDKFNNPELMMNFLWRILSITIDEQEEIYSIISQISGSPFSTMIEYFCKTYSEHVEYLIDKLIFLSQQPFKDKAKGQDIRHMFFTLRKIINRKIMSQINTQKMKSITIKSKQQKQIADKINNQSRQIVKQHNVQTKLQNPSFIEKLKQKSQSKEQQIPFKNQIRNKEFPPIHKSDNPQYLINLLLRIITVQIDDHQEIYNLYQEIVCSPFITMTKLFCKAKPDQVKNVIIKLEILQEKQYEDKVKQKDIIILFSLLRKQLTEQLSFLQKVKQKKYLNQQKNIYHKNNNFSQLEKVNQEQRTTNKQKNQIPNTNNREEKKSEAQSSSLNEESGAKRTKGVFLLLKSWFMGLTQSPTSFTGQCSDVTDRVNNDSQNKNNFFQNNELEKQPLIQSQNFLKNNKEQLQTKPIQQSPLVNNKTKNKCQKAN